MNNSKAESKGQKKYKANKYSRETSMVYRADSETGLVQINEWCRPTCNASLSFFGMPAKEFWSATPDTPVAVLADGTTTRAKGCQQRRWRVDCLRLAQGRLPDIKMTSNHKRHATPALRAVVGKLEFQTGS
eukprot:6208450-Pleurochrysis_carterae.AAC.4